MARRLKGKRPAEQFYFGDWVKDDELSLCHPATRGIWIDLMCYMWQSKEPGAVCGTVDQLSRLGRCTPEQLCDALEEIESTNTGIVLVSNAEKGVTFASLWRNGVTLHDKKVTVISRRIRREMRARKSNATRQKRHRDKQKRLPNGQSNAEVTDTSSSSTSVYPHQSPGDEARGGNAEAEWWDAVVVEVRLLGCDRSSEAVAAARRHGCSPEQVRAIIQAFKDRRSGWKRPGAVLHNRLMLPDASELEAHRGWPEATEDQDVVRIAGVRDEESERQHQKFRDDAKKKKQRLALQRELEEKHGAALDALSLEDCFALLNGKMSDRSLEQFQKDWPKSGARQTFFRLQLLQQFAAKSGE